MKNEEKVERVYYSFSEIEDYKMQIRHLKIEKERSYNSGMTMGLDYIFCDSFNTFCSFYENNLIMYYVIQNDLFKEHNHKILIDTLEKHQFEYSIVKIIPGTNELAYNTNKVDEEGNPIYEIFTIDRKDIICFGSTKLSQISNLNNWHPGSFYNSNHDYQVYNEHYKENMLNYDSVIINIKDEIPDRFNYFFAKPTADSKLFTGRLFSKEAWYDSVEVLFNSKRKISDDTKILIAPMKQTFVECRFWVIKGKVITWSLYLRGNLTICDPIVDEDIIEFAQKMVNIYQIADAFVIDIVRTPEGLKIVECNCICSAGFYAADMQKLIFELDQTFN